MKVSKDRAVYKFLYKGTIFYRLGNGLKDAQQRLANELHLLLPTAIEILDNGNKQ